MKWVFEVCRKNVFSRSRTGILPSVYTKRKFRGKMWSYAGSCQNKTSQKENWGHFSARIFGVDLNDLCLAIIGKSNYCSNVEESMNSNGVFHKNWMVDGNLQHICNLLWYHQQRWPGTISGISDIKAKWKSRNRLRKSAGTPALWQQF